MKKLILFGFILSLFIWLSGNILSLFLGLAEHAVTASDETESVKQLFDDGSEGLVDVWVEEYPKDEPASGYIVIKEYAATDESDIGYYKGYAYYDGAAIYLGKRSAEMSYKADLIQQVELCIRSYDWNKMTLQESIDKYYLTQTDPGWKDSQQPLPEMTLIKALGYNPPVKVYRKTKVDASTGKPCITRVGTGYASLFDSGCERSLYRVSYEYWISFKYYDAGTNSYQYTVPVNTGREGAADFVTMTEYTFRCVNENVTDKLLTMIGII